MYFYFQNSEKYNKIYLYIVLYYHYYNQKKIILYIIFINIIVLLLSRDIIFYNRFEISINLETHSISNIKVQNKKTKFL